MLSSPLVPVFVFFPLEVLHGNVQILVLFNRDWEEWRFSTTLPASKDRNMIKIELSYLIVVSYNQFLFKIVPNTKPSYCLVHFDSVVAAAKVRSGVSGGQDRELRTEPASQADHTIALRKSPPTSKHTETWPLCLIMENKNILEKDIICCRRSKQSSDPSLHQPSPGTQPWCPLGEGAAAGAGAQPGLPAFTSAFWLQPHHQVNPQLMWHMCFILCLLLVSTLHIY